MTTGDGIDEHTPSRVLVIDDEPTVIRVVSRALRPEFSVEAVDSAAKALDLLKTGVNFAVILCDLHMVGMSGRAFYEVVSTAMPSIAPRIVFLSGATSDDESMDFFASISNPHLDKPFALEALRSVVRSVCEQGSIQHAA